MWDQFRKALPAVAAACSAAKTWSANVLEGESFTNASKAAEKQYNNALHSNRLKTAINQHVDKAQKVVEAIVDELGLSGKGALPSKAKKPVAKKPAVKKAVVAAKKPAAKKPVVKKAVVATKKPVAKKPVVKKAVVATKKPIAKKTTLKKPAKKK
jgi:histone H1/5